MQSCEQHEVSSQDPGHTVGRRETCHLRQEVTYHVSTDVAKAQNAEEERDAKGQRDKAIPHAMALGTGKQLIGQAAIACSAVSQAGMRMLHRGLCCRRDLQRICRRGLTLCQAWQCQVTASAINLCRRQLNCYLKPNAACWCTHGEHCLRMPSAAEA